MTNIKEGPIFLAMFFLLCTDFRATVFIKEIFMIKRYIFLTLSAIAFMTSSLKAEELDSKAYVKSIVQEALSIVNKDADDNAKRKELSESVNNHLDIKWISDKIFGDEYRNLSDSDKNLVEGYLKNYLLKFYAGEGKLSAMVGAKLSDIGGRDVEAMGGGKVKVSTKFSKEGSLQKTVIAWIVKDKKVLYVEVEGINQIITLRSEMKSAKGNQRLIDFVRPKS